MGVSFENKKGPSHVGRGRVVTRELNYRGLASLGYARNPPPNESDEGAGKEEGGGAAHGARIRSRARPRKAGRALIRLGSGCTPLVCSATKRSGRMKRSRPSPSVDASRSTRRRDDSGWFVVTASAGTCLRSRSAGRPSSRPSGCTATLGGG